MSGRCLLDTNIVIALFANESSVIDNLAQVDEVFIPSIVIGELFFGAQKSSRLKENLLQVASFAASSVVLSCDTETARHYGEIKNALRAKGRPLPENDIWIAAIAQQHDLNIASRDAHFSEIDNLTILRW